VNLDLVGGQGNTAWHPVFGQVRYKVRELGWEPDEQVRRTVALMREKVREDAKDPRFVQRARGLFHNPQDQFGLVEQVWGHAKGGIRFQQDEEIGAGVGGLGEGDVIETIIRPQDMARYVDQGIACGDCDDFSMYQAALLEALGVPCAFVTVGADSRMPDQFSHVYVAAYPKDGNGEPVRVALDASHGDYPGWEVPNRFGKYQEWAVGSPEMFSAAWVGNAVLQGIFVAGLWWLVKRMAGARLGAVL